MTRYKLVLVLLLVVNCRTVTVVPKTHDTSVLNRIANKEIEEKGYLAKENAEYLIESNDALRIENENLRKALREDQTTFFGEIKSLLPYLIALLVLILIAIYFYRKKRLT